ncbi:MAG: phosphoribosylformylglycinamidine cyclo-ligase [Planctomycetota bacterium]
MTGGSNKRGLTYECAGVSIERGDSFASSIVAHMRRTHGPRVIDNAGGFAGLFRLDYDESLFRRNYKDPVLVACTDGVGTKLLLARDLDRYEGVGQDLVAMNVNDLVVQGAEPLLFLDYIACGAVEQSVLERVVKSIADACAACDCALLGGETAEMPDLYAPGEIDLAGFSLGVVELSRAMDSGRVEPGDVIIGLESDGVHSNGFSLVRAVLTESGADLGSPASEIAPELEGTVGEYLLRPTRLYARPVVRVLRRYTVKKVVSGMAHITGGGIEGNLVRALHDRVDAKIDTNAWTSDPVFPWLQERGGVETDEMRRVFNMGIGYCLIVRPSFAASIQRRLNRFGERARLIGEVVRGDGRVILSG